MEQLSDASADDVADHESIEDMRVNDEPRRRNVASSSRSVIIGSVLLCLSQFLFGTNEVIVKICNVPESQLLAATFLIQLTLSLTWWNLMAPTKENRNRHWYGDKPYRLNIWMRGFLYFLVLLTGYYGLNGLPLADQLIIMYQAPLWTVIIARIYLKEQLPALSVFVPSLVLVIAGVIVLCQPSVLPSVIFKDSKPLDIISVLATCFGMFCWVFCNILTRTAVGAHFLQLEMATAIQSGFIWIPLLYIINELFVHDVYFNGNGWLFDQYSIMYMVSIGCLGFMAMALLIIAYQYAEATKIAWLEYTQIVFAILYQIYVFNDAPNIYEIIGACMVVMGCVLPLCSELYNHCRPNKNMSVVYCPVARNSDV